MLLFGVALINTMTLNYISMGYSSEPKDIDFPFQTFTGCISDFWFRAHLRKVVRKKKVAMEDGMVQTIRVVTIK